MEFTKEFKAENRYFIASNAVELSTITQSDVDWFIVLDALWSSYEDNYADNALIYALESYKVSNARITKISEECKQAQDALGMTICSHLLDLGEENRSFIVENRSFFWEYVYDCVIPQIDKNYQREEPEEVVEVLAPASKPNIGITLKESQKYMEGIYSFSLNGVLNYAPKTFQVVCSSDFKELSMLNFKEVESIKFL